MVTMSNADIVDIILPNIDIEPIKLALQTRWEALKSQLNTEAAEQFDKDTENIGITAKKKDESIVFSFEPVKSSYLEYLADPYVPLSGGTNGIVQDLDGSHHVSNVPKELQGEPLPWYKPMPIDVESEANQIVGLMAHSAIENAVSRSQKQIKELVAPIYKEELHRMFGGD